MITNTRYEIVEEAIVKPVYPDGLYEVAVVVGISDDIEKEVIQRFTDNLKEYCNEVPAVILLVNDTYINEIYCRSKALNYGIKYAVGIAEQVVCADIDITTDFDIIDYTVDNTPENGFLCVKCQTESGAFIPEGLGGWVAAYPETWYKTGGWDERMEGWGYEDNALEKRASSLGITFLQNDMYTITHHDHRGRLNNPSMLGRNKTISETEQPTFLDKDKDFSNVVWTYWEDTENGIRPGYTELCVMTQRKMIKGMRHIRITPDNVEFFIPDLHKDFMKMKNPANRSDYVRCMLLYQYGGIYTDVDIIATTDWEKSIIEPMREEGYDIALMAGVVPQVCFIAAEPKADMLIYWKNRFSAYFAKEEWRVVHDYLHVSMGFIAPFVKSNPDCYYKIKEDECMPVKFADMNKLTSMDAIDTDNLLMIALFNTRMSYREKLMTAEEIMASGSPLAGVFKQML